MTPKHRVAAFPEGDVAINNNNNNNNDEHYDNNYQTTETDSDKNAQIKQLTRQQFVEINPLAHKSIGKLSEISIFFCTVTYSLLQTASILTTFTLIYLIFTQYYYISLAYLAYLILDRNTCNLGGRRLNSIYESSFWTNLAAYFPIKLRHTNEFNLSKKENYILNYHPHGISAFGAVTVFATNGLKFNQMFPGIISRFMVHETSFLVPIMKEVFSLRGDCSVNSRSIDHMLMEEGKGNLLCLVGGGLAEADLSDQKVLKVVVAQRKGFVKKALIHGANLIPCIAFGENSVFNKVNLEKKSLLHELESRWYKLFKFKHPIYYGRSFFSSKGKGIMPYKRPITVVMGNPIKVDKVSDPSQAQLDQLHARYMSELNDIYLANSDLCQEFDTKLELV